MWSFRSISAAALAALLIAFAEPGGGRAQDGGAWQIREDGAIVADYGIYTYRDLGSVEAPNDISGWQFVAEDVRLRHRTLTVLAQPMLTFGMRYRIVDERLFGRKLRLVVRFPRITNPANGRTGTMLSEEFVATGRLEETLFRFDHRWEMAEGRWSFTVFDGRRIVARVPFRVVVALN